MSSDASVLFAMVLSRVEHKEWPQNLNAQQVEELVSGFGSYEKMFGRIEQLAYEKKLKLDCAYDPVLFGARWQILIVRALRSCLGAPAYVMYGEIRCGFS